MASQIELMREALKKQEAQRSGTSTTPTDRPITQTYPFWDQSNDSVIRFIPDGNDENQFFWQEKQMIHLTFPPAVGEKYNIVIKVPCLHMYGLKDPIIDYFRNYWNGSDADKALAKQYYKKVSYLFQGFVINDGVQEAEPLENPIRKFIFGKQLFNIVKSTILDEDFNIDVTDNENGLDFKIIKTQTGDYSNYSTSKFVRNNTALTPTQLEAIETYGLNDLSKDIPAKPSQEEINDYWAMFQDSLNQVSFDESRFGQYRHG